jgi:hypothetical protein
VYISKFGTSNEGCGSKRAVVVVLLLLMMITRSFSL